MFTKIMPVRIVRRPFTIVRDIARPVLNLIRRSVLIHEIRNREPPLIRSRYELSLLTREDVYLADEEIAVLTRFAEEADKTIVEIGAAFGGSSSIFILHAGPRVTVHSIDPFITDSMSPFRATEERCFASVKRVLRACNKESALLRWQLHRRYSYDVVANWSTPIDLLFIDGDHRYEAVRKDFDDWFPYITPGGLMILHDSRRLPGLPAYLFNRGWPGPTQLASELTASPGLRQEDEAVSITVWRKLC